METDRLPEEHEPSANSGSRGSILVVSFHAPPDRAIGGRRWWELSRQLANRGWKTRIITAEPNAPEAARGSLVAVEHVPVRPTLDDAYARLKETLRGSQGRSDDGAQNPSDRAGDPRIRPHGPPGLVDQMWTRVRRNLGGALSFPDHGRGWIRPVARAVRETVALASPDLVISTGPPHSVHVGVHRGLSGTTVPWIADFRDPWSDESRVHLDVSWARHLFGRLEADVVRGSSTVLTTTPELAARFRHRYPGASVLCIHNGVDRSSLPDRNRARSAGLEVSHIGSLYHRRDPVPAVRGFARFLERIPEVDRTSSRIRFVGQVSEDYRRSIFHAAREGTVAVQVDLPGLQPRDAAMEMLAGTGVALVLAQGQPTQVPAKLYESVGIGVPTLVISEPDSATSHAACRLGAETSQPHDIEGIADALFRAWSGDWNGQVPSGVALDYRELAEQLEERVLVPLLAGSRREP